MSETSKRFKMRRAIRNVLGPCILCSVLASAGCGYVAPSVTPRPLSPRIDWGMSLLSGGYVDNGQFPAKLMSTLLQTAPTILLFSTPTCLDLLDHPRTSWPSTIFIQRKAVWAACAFRMGPLCIGHILLESGERARLLPSPLMVRKLPLWKMEDSALQF